MTDIKELGIKELEGVLEEWGEPAYHGRQVFKWIFEKKVKAFSEMSDLPQGLRRRLAERFFILGLSTAERLCSQDGTQKFLFCLPDNSLIESVLIPSVQRVTGCLSSQIGCRFRCAFCASGMLGFKGNLSCGQILDQALCLSREAGPRKLTHIVFMGTGEPLDNYDNVLKAIRIINAPSGMGIASRRITVSTCGLLPQIERLSTEGLQVELSVSLHAADDATRSRLLPVNKKYPLKELMACCRRYIQKTGRQLTFEYVLLKEVNSDLQSARRLAKIMQELELCKVNLIPANTVRECGFAPPNKLEALLFRDFLAKSGVTVTLRRSRGRDIEAACGQLRLRYAHKQR